jgi:hypothetical protein
MNVKVTKTVPACLQSHNVGYHGRVGPELSEPHRKNITAIRLRFRDTVEKKRKLINDKLILHSHFTLIL